jgi:hypothetical protein
MEVIASGSSLDDIPSTPPTAPPSGPPTRVPNQGATTRGAMLYWWALGVFVLALAWSRAVALGTTPIGRSEEHFAIGQRLYRTDSLAAGSDPGVLRPPGYPAFVAATLHLRDALAAIRGLGPSQAGADEDAVLLGQCLVVAATATVIFAFGATVLSPLEAACAGLVFACGPITIALVGLRSYHVLHILGLAVGTAQLALAARSPRGSPLDGLLPGILWAIATLVRPVSLILPPFVLLLARLRRGGTWRSAALFTLLFTVGMAIPILPYTVRNHYVTGRLVLVNVQGGVQLWGATVERPQAPEDSLTWLALWGQYGMNIYRQVTGDAEYNLTVYSTHVIELEGAFRRQALRNLRRRPSVYLHNVVNNLRRFCSDPMASWPTTFADQNSLPRSRTRFVVSAYSLGLLLLAIPGLVRGLCRRDASAWTLLLVFCSLATAHAVGFFYDRYSYVKLPLLAMAFTITLASLEDRSIVLGRTRVRLRLAALLAVTVLVGSASATVLVLVR